METTCGVHQSIVGAPQYVVGMSSSPCNAVLLPNANSSACCSASKLADILESNDKRWAMAGEGRLGRTCALYQERIECAAECSVDAADWFDSENNRVHLCGPFCLQTWKECYRVKLLPCTPIHPSLPSLFPTPCTRQLPASIS